MRKILGLFLLIFISSSAFALELMNPPTQQPESNNKIRFDIYYRRTLKQNLIVSVGGNSSVNVRSSTITASSTADLESEGSAHGELAKMSVQPFEKPIQFYFVGGISSYNLKIPSGSFSNSYATNQNGYVLGGGVNYILVPHTLVNPAVSLDFSAIHSQYRLTSFQAGDGSTVLAPEYLLTLFEMQAALSVGQRYGFNFSSKRMFVDPYLGVKVIRSRIGLDDLSSGAHFSGTHLGVSPYVGFKLIPGRYMSLIVEGSFIKEVLVASGLTFSF